MRQIAAFAIAYLLLASAGPSIGQTYTVEKVRDIPLLMDDDIVGGVSDMVMDADGRFFLADYGQQTIWVAESSGLISRRLGREGTGPGELVEPRSVAVFEDKVVVLDTGDNRVKIFTKDGTHLSDFRIAPVLPPSGLLIGGGGLIAVSYATDKPHLTIFDMAGTVIREFGTPDTGVGGLMIMPIRMNFHHVSQAPDGLILNATVKRYEVFRLDWDGSIRNTYSADPDGYSPFPDVPPQELVTFTPLFRPLYVSGHVLVQRQGKATSGVYGLFGDLFTEDGAIVQTGIEIPLLFFYSDGDECYGIDTTPVDEGEDNPHIVVYRLREEDGR